MTRRPLVVLGIGNTLLGDDGVGVHIVRALTGAAPASALTIGGPADAFAIGDPAGADGAGTGAGGGYPEAGLPGLPPGTEVIDGGTGGLSLLPLVREADALVVADAVDVGKEPGSVHVLTGDDLYSGLVKLSVHQVGASDLLAAARLTGRSPNRVVLVGVQPATLAPNVELSPSVAAALPAALDAVRHWCHRLVAEPREVR